MTKKWNDAQRSGLTSNRSHDEAQEKAKFVPIFLDVAGLLHIEWSLLLLGSIGIRKSGVHNDFQP